MCDNGQCIDSGYRCDTIDDCEDRSDEDPQRCPGRQPAPGNFANKFSL